MSDYIDRQAAIKAVYSIAPIDTELEGVLLDRLDLRYVLEALPSADVEPVVRCKDCEFYTEDERWCRRLGLCGAFDANGYCSHAERSEE